MVTILVSCVFCKVQQCSALSRHCLSRRTPVKGLFRLELLQAERQQKTKEILHGKKSHFVCLHAHSWGLYMQEENLEAMECSRSHRSPECFGLAGN